MDAGMLKIVIADDSRSDMAIISDMLSDYQLRQAFNGREVMALIDAEPDIDLVVLDLNMPIMNGFEVLEALQKPDYQNIVTIILTNQDEIDNEVRGLSLGAMDYIRKPLSLAALRKRIEIQLAFKESRMLMEQYNQRLQLEVEAQTRELALTRDITIHALIGLLEARNIESSNHTQRTQHMVRKLSLQLRRNPKYHSILTDEYIRELFQTAPLHDIGKVGIPDQILLKPGRLTGEEFEIMKKHVRYGAAALEFGVRDREMPAFIRTALDIIRTHHERYDGKGYPNGLAGEDIPLCGRLIALVDVYDALVHPRVYKQAFSHQTALDIIRSERGKHFDPDIVDAFLDIHSDMEQIASLFRQIDREEDFA